MSLLRTRARAVSDTSVSTSSPQHIIKFVNQHVQFETGSRPEKNEKCDPDPNQNVSDPLIAQGRSGSGLKKQLDPDPALQNLNKYLMKNFLELKKTKKFLKTMER